MEAASEKEKREKENLLPGLRQDSLTVWIRTSSASRTGTQQKKKREEKNKEKHTGRGEAVAKFNKETVVELNLNASLISCLGFFRGK